MDIDDETLMALADGEITGDAAARLHARIAADPELAARYTVFMQTAQLVNAAARADPDASVSADFAQRIRDTSSAGGSRVENVVPLQRRMPRWQVAAMAASVALAMGLSAGLFLSPEAPKPDGVVLTADLRDRLGTLPSGAQAQLSDGRSVSIVASFMDGAGAFCREYETRASDGTDYVGVACRDGAGWSLRFTMATPAEADGYAPAASLEALDAFHAATDASQPLSADEERAFLR